MGENMDFGMKCIKYMLCISNFMFVIIGILLIVVGSSVTTLYYKYEVFLESYNFSPAMLLISIGVTMTLVSLFGCVGSWRKSTFLVNLYTLLLCVLFIMELSAAITAYVKRDSIEESVEATMRDTLEDYNKVDAATKGWDFVQENLECCGVRKLNDWAIYEINGTTIMFENDEFDIPYSCCVTSYCLYVYSGGCLNKVVYILSQSAFMIGTGAFCVAIVQILGIVFGNMLAKSIRRVKTQEEMNKQNQRHIIYNLQNENYSLKPTSKA
ncbi:CD63 antigen-like isoform X1 [Photinus pyralis]|nr:CD63 antigen-like isoform X1 [Photinus pyralis]